ncbi:hypothetical protein Raf01_49090 [Rugosimonospora africana]|uniref:Uncharacterized protein n=1 Tax=Rugosimonospora africana TaxID=556532 RepID=A0A8J3VS03_9ACTN|nr:hypothetical protein Raf01_49090 [Rugosimonospora africana]
MAARLRALVGLLPGCTLAALLAPAARAVAMTNPGFEQPVTGGVIPGWRQTFGRAPAFAVVDTSPDRSLYGASIGVLFEMTLENRCLLTPLVARFCPRPSSPLSLAWLVHQSPVPPPARRRPPPIRCPWALR